MNLGLTDVEYTLKQKMSGKVILVFMLLGVVYFGGEADKCSHDGTCFRGECIDKTIIIIQVDVAGIIVTVCNQTC